MHLPLSISRVPLQFPRWLKFGLILAFLGCGFAAEQVVQLPQQMRNKCTSSCISKSYCRKSHSFLYNRSKHLSPSQAHFGTLESVLLSHNERLFSSEEIVDRMAKQRVQLLVALLFFRISKSRMKL